MGYHSELEVETQALHSCALSYLVEIGAARTCSPHGTYICKVDELDDELMRHLTSDRRRGRNGPLIWACELTDEESVRVLQDAFANRNRTCPYYEKNELE